MTADIIPLSDVLSAHIGEDLVEIYHSDGLLIKRFHFGQGKDQSLLLRLIADVYHRGHRVGFDEGKKAAKRKIQQAIGLLPED